MFTCGKHGVEAPPVFLPVRAGRAACRFAAPATQGIASPLQWAKPSRKLCLLAGGLCLRQTDFVGVYPPTLPSRPLRVCAVCANSFYLTTML